MVLTLVATRKSDSEVMKDIANLCYPKWALQAFVVANAERYGRTPFSVQVNAQIFATCCYLGYYESFLFASK